MNHRATLRRGYVRPMQGWWRRDPFFVKYMIREVTAVGVLVYAIILMFGVLRLSQGEAAWNGWLAALRSPGSVLLHVVLLLLSSDAKFRIVDALYPMVGPKQPVINTLGALALYALIVIVVTSYYRAAIGHDRWRIIHYGTYLAAGLFFVHGIWSDPTLKDKPIDYLDAEKFWIELCFLIIIAGTIYRWRDAMRRRQALGARRPIRESSAA